MSAEPFDAEVVLGWLRSVADRPSVKLTPEIMNYALLNYDSYEGMIGSLVALLAGEPF